MTTHLTFFEHLEELRKRIWVGLVALLVGSIGCYCFADRALHFVVRPLENVAQVYFFSPQEAFVVKIKLAILSGLILTSPVIAGQFWLFISPALRAHEKKAVLPLVLVTSFLFLTGVVFCFFLVMPVALKFLVGQQTSFLKPMISITEYISFLSMMLLGFGFAFNVPVLILALVSVGILSAATLNKYHRHAIVAIFIAAAILTPGPDIASQLMLAIPLLVLFEISLLIAFILDRRKGRAK